MTQPPYRDEPQPSPPGADPGNRVRRPNRLVIVLIVAVALAVVAVPTLLVPAPLVLTRQAVPSPEAGAPSGVHGLAPGVTAQPTPRRTPRATTGSTPTATGSDSPTPTPPPAASPPPRKTSADSGFHYRIPRDFCKALDLSPFASLGLNDRPTDNSKFGTKDFAHRSCAYPYRNATIGGSLVVDAIFTQSIGDAGSAYDMERTDRHSETPPSGFVDDNTIGAESFVARQTVEEVRQSFLDVGVRDGTVVVVVGVSLYNAKGAGTPTQQREMIDRLHRTARTVLTSLRR